MRIWRTAVATVIRDGESLAPEHAIKSEWHLRKVLSPLSGIDFFLGAACRHSKVLLGKAEHAVCDEPSHPNPPYPDWTSGDRRVRTTESGVRRHGCVHRSLSTSAWLIRCVVALLARFVSH